MKKCNKCKIDKYLSEFSKDKYTKDELQNTCKECKKKQLKEYFRTKDGLISKIYGSQKRSSKKRGHRPPEYTKQELKEWLFSQELFHKLYDEWKMSKCKNRLVPSVDRLNDNIHYCFNNIQLMTWKQNKDKGHRDMRSGKLIHGVNPQKRVYQYSKDNKFIAKYHSMNEADRQTGISFKNISSCCSGRRKIAGGFKWSFKKENENE